VTRRTHKALGDGSNTTRRGAPLPAEWDGCACRPGYNAPVGSLARAMFLGLTIAAALAGCRGILGIEPLAAEVPGDAASDDAVAPDVATDAAPDVDAGPPYCTTLSPAPQFCADFDEEDFERGWDNDTHAGIPDPGEIGGGMLSADRKVFLSKPASLLVQTGYKLSTTGNLAAIVVKSVPSTSRLTLQFDLWVDEIDVTATAGVTVAGLDYANDGDIEVFLDSDGLELAVQGPDPDAGPISVQHVVTPFPTGMWTTIELIVSTLPTTGQPGGWVNAECAGGSATAALPLLIENRIAPSFQVVLGSSPGGPVGPFQANVDNVRMYWK
jgi:hypothetical protein